MDKLTNSKLTAQPLADAGSRLPKIGFNRPFATGQEIAYIQEAIAEAHLSGNGSFTQKCQSWLETVTGCRAAFLTHSGTAALEMAAILLDVQPGDEIIMPSFTFVSTANAFVLRGATPVFVDIRQDILNIDENLVREAINPKTKAILPVHYAGVSCAMDEIMNVANKQGIAVVEDAAHSMLAKYHNRALGSIGHLAALSFHETKNIISGEGGALLVNDERFVKRAAIVWEKGTNRQEFFLGQADKYTWQDVGSSFLLSEVLAAFLWAQMESAQEITGKRLKIWQAYHVLFEELEQEGFVRRPVVPAECTINGHIYYLIVPTAEIRTKLLSFLNAQGIVAVFHYVPLHQSPAGKKFGRNHGNLLNTELLSERLVRLPLWVGLTEEAVERVCEQINIFFHTQI